jgi:spore germination protein YaaH
MKDGSVNSRSDCGWLDKVEFSAGLSKVTYGFWPYWIDSHSYQPDWSGLTHVSYFSMDANSDGTLDTSHIGADYYNVRDTAHSHNVRVTLTVTRHGFSSDDQDIQDYILAYHRNDLANNILQKLQAYDADGVSIDFENVRSTNSYTGGSNIVLMEQFMQVLHDTLKNADPNYHISFCVMGSVETVYRNAALSQYTDAVFLMGYDYHWQSAPTTGAVSPYNDPTQLDVVDSVNILENYYPSNKIILGLPFYGYDWPCESDSPGSNTIGTGTAVRMENAIANAQIYGRMWDTASHTPWYRYQSDSTWHQCWYDDEESLGSKFDYVNSANIAGTGFWALGYEGNNANIWNVVKEKFSS